MTFDLVSLGWGPRWQELMDAQPEGLIPARVAVEHRGAYLVNCELGEMWAQITGRLRFRAEERLDLPVVGDWVACRPPDEGPALIVSVLERLNAFTRQGPIGRYEQRRRDTQAIAANIDLLVVVAALTSEFNPRRIERYLAMAWEGGCEPAIVLNKADLGDVEAGLTTTDRIAPGVEVAVTDALSGTGVEGLSALVQGRTVALVGSSGVGKTTLINRLVGDGSRATKPTRADGKGRHATTIRELIVLAEGGLVIDTPGFKELHVSGGEGIDRTFTDVTDLFGSCRFVDCSHGPEPGCAIKDAVEEGSLDRERWEQYQRLQREMIYEASKVRRKAREAREKQKLRAPELEPVWKLDWE